MLRPALLLLAASGLAAAEAPWTSLFDGKTLNGWTQRGGKATYEVVDGTIVGTSTVNTPNSFLCTERDYADFILEYEFHVDPRLNSGVQIRSRSLPQETTYTINGRDIKVPAGRVHGYQVEIDPDPTKDRWWSTGIYDESRRGWLYPGALGGNAKDFTNQGRKIFRQNDWNLVRVEAIGGSIRTFLNGTPAAHIEDHLTLSGFIGLQVHSIPNAEIAGTQVRWRNIRIREIGRETPNRLTDEENALGWKLLWDGKSSTGWRSARSPQFPKNGWEIKDGELTIHESGGGEAAAAGDIITTEAFSDFELQVDFRITPGANSGIKIFVDPDLNQGKGSSIGPEFQILCDARHPDAKQGRNGNRTMGSLYDMIPAPKDKKVMPPGEWNHARILSHGKHVTFWLNGEETVRFERGSEAWRKEVQNSKYKVWPNFGENASGHILLQDHGNTVSFRNIKIRVPKAD